MDLNSPHLNYSYAKPIGSSGPWEKVIDSDYPMNLDGTRAGQEDAFKLEFSGWSRHIIFKPK